ncbi:hypothetical protein ACIRRA_22255 [Nocardia sp. NPDC101769]|uniref:hypothetical protein n=1 Tax=Nocardia sp. NPDC101769 TaxID=3364333 RepID=UPI0037F666CA
MCPQTGETPCGGAVGNIEDRGDPAERGSSVDLQGVQQPEIDGVEHDEIHQASIGWCRIAAPLADFIDASTVPTKDRRHDR